MLEAFLMPQNGGYRFEREDYLGATMIDRLEDGSIKIMGFVKNAIPKSLLDPGNEEELEKELTKLIEGYKPNPFMEKYHTIIKPPVKGE